MKRVSKAETEEHFVRIKKINDEKQVVYGEVYAPDVLDTYGDFMSAEDIEKMAHRFMQLVTLRQSIDTNHNEESNGSYPIESFIARDGDPDYTPGSWVLGVKVEDKEVWASIKKGELNGYSFQALVRKVAVVVEVCMTPDIAGVTELAADHDHMFYVEFDTDGRVLRGRTSTDNGHFHHISKGTATDEADGHAHRINLGD
jgi:hypothetical protein